MIFALTSVPAHSMPAGKAESVRPSAPLICLTLWSSVNERRPSSQILVLPAARARDRSIRSFQDLPSGGQR
ncbi:hypothetical protein AB0J35_04690 [Nonomuraea angiospora]|uniref:hypothetical protein n=1 Tax=Nonomuraea angiospora TaxID=46172 RepID=UPI003415A0A3